MRVALSLSPSQAPVQWGQPEWRPGYGDVVVRHGFADSQCALPDVVVCSPLGVAVLPAVVAVWQFVAFLAVAPVVGQLPPHRDAIIASHHNETNHH